MARQMREAKVIEDITNCPETKRIPAGEWVIATEVLGVPDKWDVKVPGPNDTEIHYVDQKYLIFI